MRSPTGPVSYTAYGYLDGFHEVFFAEEPYKNAQLIVPESSLSEYMSSRFWSFFSKISTFYDGDYESDSEDDSIIINITDEEEYEADNERDSIYLTTDEERYEYLSKYTDTVASFVNDKLVKKMK